jgi:hypothetical protein
MTTAMKSLAEMTTAELWSLKAEVYEVAREQDFRLGMTPSRGLQQSYGETMRFLGRIDNELDRRGA